MHHAINMGAKRLSFCKNDRRWLNLSQLATILEYGLQARLQGVGGLHWSSFGRQLAGTKLLTKSHVHCGVTGTQFSLLVE